MGLLQGGGGWRRILPLFKKRWLVILLVFLFLFLGFLGFTLGRTWAVYRFARALDPSVQKLEGAIAAKDLALAGEGVEELSQGVTKLRTSFSKLSYLRFFPGIALYFSDGQHLLAATDLAVSAGKVLVAALLPYEGPLGLKAGFASGITVEQQLANLLATLPQLGGQLDSVWENLISIKDELAQINSARYPAQVGEIRVRFWLAEAQRILEETEPLILEGRKILALAPALLGSPKRTYLVLFQNDAELRATGGFITGISLVGLENGRVVQNDFKSGAFVAQTTPYIRPPDPLGRYLRVGTWHFQDGNYSPDFPTASRQLLEMWRLSRLPAVGGVIGVNTQVASAILDLTGPIRIPGYDLDLSRSALPQSCRSGGQDFTRENLVCRLEYYVEKNPIKGESTEARKIILDRISDAVIQRISASRAEIWPQLVDFAFEHLRNRDLILFSVDPAEQDLFVKFGFGGEIKESAGDYLMIVDSNFGGKKTDMFMTESVVQRIERAESGAWRKTIQIKYFNPQPYDNWLSFAYKDFVRLYVPLGSKLVQVAGAQQEWGSWEENGKTVFGAYFSVWPQTEHVLSFTYELPAALGADWGAGGFYRLFLQRQSGTNIGLVGSDFGATMETVDLEEDRTLELPIP